MYLKKTKLRCIKIYISESTQLRFESSWIKGDEQFHGMGIDAGYLNTSESRNAFNYSTMYFQINGLNDTESAALSTMFQLACAIGNVLGGSPTTETTSKLMRS